MSLTADSDLTGRTNGADATLSVTKGTVVDLKERCRLPELMDDPELDAAHHHAALDGLRRVNRISRSGAILWSALKRIAADQPGRRLRVLDIASGGGDVVVDVARRARRAGVALRIDGCDVSQRAIEFAQQFAAANKSPDHQFFRLDVLQDSLPNDYDIVMCSLFLHHLSETDAVRLLTRMSAACRKHMLINDLRRTRVGYLMAQAGCRLLTRSPVVHVDGPLSVRAAWSDDEVRRLAQDAGLGEVRLSHHWPQRFLLSWSRP